MRARPRDYGFDLLASLDSIVKVTASVPRDAVTAEIFGTTRVGSGTCIVEAGVFVTAAHLVADAAVIALQTSCGRGAAATLVGCDHASGLALLRAARTADVRPLRMGNPVLVPVAAHIVVAASGGLDQALAARVAYRQPFAGHWEYALDEAILTTPAHPRCVGAALIGAGGELIGVSSVELLRARPAGPKEQLNLAVPIDLLTPVLGGLLQTGRAPGAARPWLGLYAIDVEGQAIIAEVAPRGPADAAGLRKGDAVVAVNGVPLVAGAGRRVEELFRKVWAAGIAGVEVALLIERDRRTFVLRVGSRDRDDPLRPARVH